MAFTSLRARKDGPWAPISSIKSLSLSTYSENIILDSNKVIALQGGWDTSFISNSFYTTIKGSITIANGKMIVENPASLVE
jgi:hypothetical protein